MKKATDKQAAVFIKQQIDPSAIFNYPRVHTKEHPDDYKIPIADLLNPDCPISAGVYEEMRPELLKLQEAGQEYVYYASPVVVLDTSDPASKALVDDALRDNLLMQQANKGNEEKDTETICFVDTILDRSNAISNIVVDEDVRRLITIIKAISEGARAYLSPEESDDVLSFFFRNPNAVINNLYEQAVKKGLDPQHLPIVEVFSSEIFITALKEAGYKSEPPAAEEPPTPPKRPDTLDMPTDNLSAVIPRLLTDKRVKKLMPGQLSFIRPGAIEPGQLDSYDTYAVNTSHRGEKDPAFIIFGISSIDPNIARQLTEYDKRVAIAYFGLIMAGLKQYNNLNFRMTVAQIAYSMGIDRTPNDNDYKNINDALTKFSALRVFIENHYESQKYKSRSYQRYDEAFCTFGRLEEYENGKKTTYIYPHRVPPLLANAITRKQITTIKRAWLAVNTVNQTETSLGLQHYFLEWIAQLKNTNNKISNPTISYKRLGEIVSYKGKLSRLQTTVKKILDFYKSGKDHCITDYEEIEMKDGKGVKIIL